MARRLAGRCAVTSSRQPRTVVSSIGASAASVHPQIGYATCLIPVMAAASQAMRAAAS